MTWQSAPIAVDPTVSTQWLADHLGSERLIVIDCSVVELPSQDGAAPRLLNGLDQFLFDGHIPTAVFADLVGPSADPFAGIGITAEHTIVVYDGADGRFADRSWELLRERGHAQVAVLTGGLRRWRSEGRTVEDGVSDGATR